MKKILPILTALVVIFSFVSAEITSAKSRSGSFKSSGSSSYKSGRSSYKSPSSSKSSTSKSTKKVSKSTTKAKKETTTKKITTKTTTKQKPTVPLNSPHRSSSYFSNGSYVPYLTTATGAYLIYQGMEDDGDPIYIDSETGEEIDDDDLEDLGVSQVESVPESDDLSNSVFGTIISSLFTLMLFALFAYMTYRLFTRNSRHK